MRILMPRKTRYVLEAITRDSRGYVISRGFNSYTKTHPVQAHFASLAGEPYKQSLHAEIQAILRAKDKKIYSIEVINHTTGILPYPCLTCQKAIEAFGIKKVTVRSVFKND